MKKFLLCLGICLLTVMMTNMDEKAYGEDYDPLSIIYDAVEYEEYLEKYADKVHPNEEITLFGGDAIIISDGFTVLSDYEGMDNDVLLTLEEGNATWEFFVEKEGFYNIEFVYFPVYGKNNQIERAFYVNDEIPFKGSMYLEFSRKWEDETEIMRDTRDNDVRPKQTENYSWMSAYLKDSDGFYTEAYSYYFKEGINTITISSVKEPVIIGKIILKQEETIPTYEEYKNLYEGMGATAVSLSDDIKVQGEDASYKSNSTIYPVADRTSPLTEPQSAAKLRLNIIGGTSWQQVGQWITWNVTVPEDGFYELKLKYRQNIKSGRTVNRTLYVDGSVPFAEAGNLMFAYKNEWCLMTVGDGDSPYMIYLTAGTHELKLEVTLGDELSEILRLADDSVYALNTAYRKLLMVIGSNPDTMRDYQFEKKTPEALSILKTEYEEMLHLSELIEAYSSGQKGSDTATIDNLINQLSKMNEKPETIAKQWSAFKDNIVALGSWSLSMKEQPLEIDYILISSAENKEPRVKANFFQKSWHEIKKFVASFFEDYSSVGEVYDEDAALEVWILADGAASSVTSSGRDQANIIKTLVDNYFVPETGISVNIKLVNSSVLLSATLAGTGPDAALNVAGKEPVNYALRNAVQDLTAFEDFSDVTEWFHSEAFVQFTYNGGIYALPQTMSFHVMFYRADIFKELNIKVPTNWDEFYTALAVIQKNNMNVGIFPDYTTYAMFLYQHGGEFYTEDGKASGLDSEEAIAAFKMWSGNYADYKMPITFDFANRFRSGEMPLAIGDYTNYNYLSVFAPEIKGLWGFTVVPAYIDEDGNENRQVSAWETASVIMATSDKKDEAWKFLKWWMSADIQSEYGNETENVLGVAGRVATANLSALASLPWTNSDYGTLVEQMKYVKAIPEVPGSYFTERNIKFAFYEVYNSQEDARETLENYVKTINNEITNKRKEFNLPVD